VHNSVERLDSIDIQGGFPMRRFGFMRVILLAMLVCLIPASSSAAVFISVGFAPPALPVYVQPPCPEPGWMWTPGYWAYGDDGYYWVPGTWVPAPYIGALWTPGYWGWGGGLYVWHPGYWGTHVGYYGGVNYGFGFFGVGFVGGAWAGGAFRYNTAVVNVNRTVIHNTYEDRTVISSHTVARDSHVAFSGGPGGINHPPTAQETAYSHEQHMAPTSYQTRQESAARTNVNSYASHNGGRPANVATARPMGGGAHGSASGSINYNASKSNTGNRSAPPEKRGGTNPLYEAGDKSQAARPSGTGGGGGQPHPQLHSQPHSGPAPRPQPQARGSKPGQHGGGGGGSHEHGKSH
jgi:WXXGXW repeat (2 copies)